MAIRERAPGTPRRERPHTSDANLIASYVEGVVNNFPAVQKLSMLSTP
jgi:hypothetical protein